MMTILKAASGAVAAGLAVLVGASSDGSIDLREWIETASALIVAFNAVYWVPNKPSAE